MDAVRRVLGPGVLDIRPTRIDIVTRTWAGPRRGANPGQYTDAVTSLPTYTKARHVTQREIAQSGGRYEEGDVIVGPITPAYAATQFQPAGGFTEQQLAPRASQGVEIIYRLTLQAGASGIAGEYELVELRRDKALHFDLVLTRKRTTPAVAAAPVMP